MDTTTILIILIGLVIFLTVILVLSIIGTKIHKKNYKLIKDNVEKVSQKLEEDDFTITSNVDAYTLIVLHKGFKTSRFWQPVVQFLVDSNKKRFAITSYWDGSIKYFDYDQIIGFDVVQSGESSKSTTLTSGYSTPIGNTGLRTGLGTASTSTEQFIQNLQFVLYTNDVDNPTYTLNLIQGKTSTQAPIYQKMLDFIQGVKAILSNVIDSKAEQ